MRINWGIGVTLGALAFIIFILQLVYRCANEKVDLVSEKYYEQEIRYQEQIDRKTNVNSLQRNVGVVLDGNEVSLKFPDSLLYNRVSGTINLFRPDNSDLDFSLPVRAKKDGTQRISLAEKKSGRWKVQITWTDGETPFYQEESIWVN